MALGNWKRFTAGAGKSVNLNITTPLVANGSLSMRDLAGNVGAISLILDDSFTKGFTSGRISTLTRIDEFINGSNDGSGPVLIAQQTNENFSSLGNGYVCQFGSQNGLANTFANFGLTVYSLQAGNGISGASAGTLVISTSSVFTYAIGEVYAFEYQWEADFAQYGGVRHRTRLGATNSTSFSTLAVQTDVIQTTGAPFFTSVGEGVGYWKGNATGGTGANQTCLLDETSILPGV